MDADQKDYEIEVILVAKTRVKVRGAHNAIEARNAVRKDIELGMYSIGDMDCEWSISDTVELEPGGNNNDQRNP